MKIRSEVRTSAPMSISPTHAMWEKRPMLVRSPIRSRGVTPEIAATTDSHACSCTTTPSPISIASGIETRAGGTTTDPRPNDL